MGNRRIWWGLGIIVCGLCAAWPFKKAILPAGDGDEQIVAESRPKDQAADAPRSPQPAKPTALAAEGAAEQSPADLSSLADSRQPLAAALEQGITRRPINRMDDLMPLPALESNYAPRPDALASDPRSAVLGTRGANPGTAMLPRAQPPRHYRIRKHDTLEDIALRLLGSRQHADKLLAANPGVILVPEILPVGATIIVPDFEQPPRAVVRLPEMGP